MVFVKLTLVNFAPVKFELFITELLKLMSLISELDLGPGVALEVVVTKSQFDNTEELLKKMMESGDIFQNVPGKVKVL